MGGLISWLIGGWVNGLVGWLVREYTSDGRMIENVLVESALVADV